MHQRLGVAGFSLVELSIVMIIIATVTGMGISSGASMIETSRMSQTNSKMAQIKRALYVFRNSYDRVPCPASLTLPPTASNFGEQGPSATACIDAAAGAATANRTSPAGAVVEGGVPTKSLLLPDEFAFDGWGNRIRYAVGVDYTQMSAFLSIPMSSSCSAAQVLDGTGPANFRTQAAVYTLLSNGPNGHGAYTRSGAVKSTGSVNAAELNDCDCNSSGAATTFDGIYVQQGLRANPAVANDAFDDIVEYQTRWQMQTSMESPKPTSATSIIGIAKASSSLPIQQTGAAFIFMPGSVISPSIPSPGSSGPFFGWSYGMTYLVATVDDYFYLYKRTGDTLIKRVWTSPSQSGGLTWSGPASWSHNNQYVAINIGSYIAVYRADCSNLTPLAAQTSVRGYGLPVWSPDDQFVMNSGYAWDGLLQRSGDVFTAVDNVVLFPASRTNSAMVFSPDAQNAVSVSAPRTLDLYGLSGGVYPRATTPTLTSTTDFNSIAWSPDSNYIAAVYPWSNASQKIFVIKRNGTGISATFSQLPDANVDQISPVPIGGPGYVTGWTSDSKYILSSGFNGVYYWKNNSDDTFTYVGHVDDPLAVFGYSSLNNAGFQPY